ncbi:TRAP transporter large permease [Blastococcus xanthinilyticus]|uniref:Tripartite ATP-independent transporter DctM subunit n=1 Tax=Blastococcus xanthinilyticus TaxID=1564164 RepID=A0A5S5D0J8_9ACTN|nr:TRAP transporter large permease [Blastococcus xanthinilyticus]TYP88874.1 tripartite ATP-independent transporter DctM subunit [Blastococcus xanthinilyticus]
MTAGLVTVLAVLVLLVLLCTGVPVAFALATAGVLGLVVLRGADIASSTLGSLPYQATAEATLVVIPMFILMGVLAAHARVAEDVFRISHRLLRRLPGGLGLASIAACAGFGAVSGSSVATTATVGRVAIVEMRKYGYSVSFAAGIVAAAGTLSVLIPPSIVLVIYGIITGESIGALLTAGIIPGILSALVFMTLVIIRVRLRPAIGGFNQAPAAVDDGPTLAGDRPQGKGYAGLVKIAVLFAIVIGGIYAGFFTATEAASLGALAALLMLLADVFRYGPRQLAVNLKNSFAEAASVTSFIFAILVGASLFTFFLVSAGITNSFANWALDLPVPPAVLIIVLLGIMIPLGMFLDPISIMLIVLPLAYPVVTGLGYDGIWFAILTVKMIEIGLITPPVGLNVYVLAGTPGVRLEDAFRGIAWFLPAELFTTSLLFLVPDLVTWLPSQIG